MAEASSSWLKPKRRASRIKKMAEGVTRYTVRRDGKETHVYVGEDGIERESWFSACVGGLNDPGPTK